MEMEKWEEIQEGWGGVGMARLTDHWNLAVNEREGAENRP